MAKLYRRRPSDIIGINDDDEYCKFCFDEACTYIYDKINIGKEKPRFSPFVNMKKSYKSSTEFYDEFNKKQ